MDTGDGETRLSHITTLWSLVRQAHEQTSGEFDSDDTLKARWELMQHYCGAVYRYLFAALKDREAADELFQEFALRFFRGDFHRADPTRGRFRQFVKTAVLNLIRDMQSRQKRDAFARPALEDVRVEPASFDASDADADETFLKTWREELLSRAWSGLAEMQEATGRPYLTALRARSEQPERSSADLADDLNAQLRPDPPLNATSVRKLLQRARAAFADLLLAEVSQSLEQPTPDDVEAELIDVELLTYCRSALQRLRS